MGLNTELLSYIENDEEHKCELFIENTCGCRLDNGSPCSSLFSLDEYVSHQSQASLLNRNELHLVIIGSVVSLVNTILTGRVGNINQQRGNGHLLLFYTMVNVYAKKPISSFLALTKTG